MYGDRKLVPNQNYLKYAYAYDNLPKGFLTLYDTDPSVTGEVEMPSRYDLGLGNRFVLVYFTEDEVAELSE